MHDASQASAIIKVSGVAKIFIGGNEFARIVFEIEALAQPSPCGVNAEMIHRQAAVDERQNSIDGGAAVGIESLAIAIAAGRAGFVANWFGWRKIESPIIELFIPLIPLGRKILASLGEKQRGRDGRIFVGDP